MNMSTLLRTTVVGSYPQPEWLIDREKLKTRVPARVRATELWRVSEPFLEQAQDDATIVAIRDMERAGIDIISDGEIRRESYSNRFANALGGIDRERLGSGLNRRGGPDIVPLVSGPIERREPIEVRDLAFLRANTDRSIKITLPGPFTMTRQAENRYYADEESLAMAFAAAVNAEIKELFAAGADVVQLDEPYMDSFPEQARRYAVRAINRALDGVGGTTVVHICFGYGHYLKKKTAPYAFLAELDACAADQVSIEAAQPNLDLGVLKQLPSKTIMLGVLNLGEETVETPEVVAQRLRAALKLIPPDRLIAAPDCGMKYLSRYSAFAKLKALVDGAQIVRKELGIQRQT
jgi:5-methyltetrahydropteroyltriglutamate--homocysteine methyltransferase